MIEKKLTNNRINKLSFLICVSLIFNLIPFLDIGISRNYDFLLKTIPLLFFILFSFNYCFSTRIYKFDFILIIIISMFSSLFLVSANFEITSLYYIIHIFLLIFFLRSIAIMHLNNVMQYNLIFFYFFLFLISLYILSLLAIILDIEGVKYLRYGYSSKEISYNGFFGSTNYATHFAGITFYLLLINNHKFNLLIKFSFLTIILLSLYFYQSRTSILALFGLFFIFQFILNKKNINQYLFILISIVGMTLLIIFFYNEIIIQLNSFLRIDSLNTRGFLGNRGIVWSYFWTIKDSYFISGVWPSNIMSLWSNVEFNSLYHKQIFDGYLPHSSFLTHLVGFGIITTLVLWSIIVYIFTSRFFSQYNDYYYMLLAYILFDSIVNDYIGLPGSPSTLLFIILISKVFFQKIRPYEKEKNYY